MKTQLIYLFVGSSGRLGSHLIWYFEQLSQKLQRHSSEFTILSWSRDHQGAEAHSETTDEFAADKELFEMAQKATHIWLCLPDRLIEAAHLKLAHFLKSQAGKSPVFIHSSGAWSYAGVFSAHPLMSFRPFSSKEEAYPFTTYSKMSFAVTLPEDSEPSEINASELKTSELKALLFPFLPNPIFHLPQEQKPLYHACCVLAANGAVLLWQKFFSELSKLGTPSEALQIFIKQVCENFLENPASALTGPLVRKDQKTLALDAQALAHDPYSEVFNSFARLKINSPSSLNPK